MKVLIIEDEARAARHLERLLSKVAPDMDVVASLESVRDSVEFLSTNQGIALIFSDIQLADGLSFEIYRQIKVSCPIIFTTAWDHYAIEAFNTNGIDYLLKPVEEERLLKAIEKVKQFSPMPALEKLFEMVAQKQEKQYKSRFLVKIGDRIKSIPIEEIDAFYSYEKATYLHTKGKRSYCIDFALDHLEEIVDPEKFFRINRKYLVSLNACASITAWSNSRLRLQIDGVDDKDIVVARERVQAFREWLDR
ncbi:MAG: response regulator transcription factor [Lentimicrobiaceae bacterium]|nr:response regulator transcription factor [Lentimicrobiaceae bacterium]MCO5265610.1 LytTR family DNA-binding domain-containing protein [Lentimicrobium sp.]HPG32228.1 LytTR family DNA-binding domain-containing protein [Lentimicrobium sp.]